MEPRIRYAQTKDGVSIAFMVAGDGVPVVHPFFYLSHLQLNWTNDYSGQWMRALADRYQLIAYDARGNGLSQRGVERYGLEEALCDLEAVIDKLALDRFVILAPLGHGGAAIRYAIENEGRVLGLILWAVSARTKSLNRALIETLPMENWEFFLQSVAQSANWVEPGAVRDYVDLLRQTMSRDDYRALARGSMGGLFDFEDLLPAVSVPTLVMHPKDFVMVDSEEAMHIATLIPDSRLVLLEGGSTIPSGDLLEPTIEAIEEFMSELGVGDDSATVETGDAAFRTVLFTDVEGSTALTDRLGDARARELLREHERITREALKAHGGTEVKTMGDGFMASFSSATRALECAIAVQSAFAERNESAEEPIKVRIGLNAGEPIAEDDPGGRGDLFGTAVNVAARIAAKAKGGEILASNVIRELVAGKEFLFNDRGDTELRGFEDPVRVYEVRWSEE
ncbi:MAG: adenylate/guanylate cyclase domain-containing protein [Chloroflexi bacterium]|nr:adenylate/guanylate cyclase domain-containing protein [Chloroflexota bacterium]